VCLDGFGSSDGLATGGFMSLKPAASSWELPLRGLLCSGLLCDCVSPVRAAAVGWSGHLASRVVSSVRYIYIYRTDALSNA
jgi:hypothetical protein